MGLNNTHSFNKCFLSLCRVPSVTDTAWGADILVGCQHIQLPDYGENKAEHGELEGGRF